jgi:hypothetical protein
MAGQSFVVRLTGADVTHPLKHFKAHSDADAFAKGRADDIDEARVCAVTFTETHDAIAAVQRGDYQILASYGPRASDRDIERAKEAAWAETEAQGGEAMLASLMKEWDLRGRSKAP